MKTSLPPAGIELGTFGLQQSRVSHVIHCASKTHVESNMVNLEAIGSLNETLHATIEKSPEKMKATYAEMLRDKQDNVTKHLEIINLRWP